MAKLITEKSLLGAHTSTAKGLHNALLEGEVIGANTVQLFTANQRQWKRKTLDKQAIEKFHNTREQTGIQSVMSHASYLINLGSPNQEVLEKSRLCMLEEIKSCIELDIAFLNFHPGAALQEPREKCLNKIIESLLLYAPLFQNNYRPVLLLETTAGQGSVVGNTFEELAYIISRTKESLSIGVCIDICHIFAAGYDIRTREGLKKTLKEFDEIIGLSYLQALHLNDSIYDLSSKRDRHAPLGEGKIGWSAFENLMLLEETKNLPKYLETPGGDILWEKEIKELRSFTRK